MFKKLIASFKGLAEQAAFDPNQFIDPVATRTDWSPLKGGGTNFKTHKLKKVHALQLISEYVRGDKSSYYSYELNLVLKDGERINVIDHGDRSAIQRDAQALAGFLGKPLWSRL